MPETCNVPYKGTDPTYAALVCQDSRDHDGNHRAMHEDDDGQPDLIEWGWEAPTEGAPNQELRT